MSFERRNRQKIKIINDNGDVVFGVSNGINIYSSTKIILKDFLVTGVGVELNVLSKLIKIKVSYRI